MTQPGRDCARCAGQRGASGWLVRQGDLALTYAELERASGQAAALLREAGVGPGDRAALMLPNVLAYPLFFYGSLRRRRRRSCR